MKASNSRILDIPLHSWCLYLLLFALGVFLRTDAVLNHDVAWLLVAAGRMLDGGTYTDAFFEMNMPLAIAAYVPPRLVSDGLGVTLPQACGLWTGAMIAHAVALVASMRFPVGGATTKAVWTGCILFALAFVPAYHFAQKEHLSAILTAPFLVLLAVGPGAQGNGLRIHVAALAAIGFAIKPHFAPLPFLLLGGASVMAGSLAPLRSMEARTIVLAGATVGLVSLLAYPEWLVCADWAARLYGAYGRANLVDVFRVSPVPVYLSMFAALLVLSARSRPYREEAWPFLASAAYGMVAYLLQRKGWAYQFLPVSIPVAVALGIAVVHLRRELRTPKPGGLLVAAIVLTLGAATGVQVAIDNRTMPQWRRMREEPVARGLAVAAPGEAAYILTTTIVPGFPTVLHLGLEWGSRLPSLWPLAGLLKNAEDLPSDLRLAYGASLTGMLVEDLERYRPAVVLLDRRPGQFGLPPGFDILRHFALDARFASAWKEYTLLREDPDYSVFVRKP